MVVIMAVVMINVILRALFNHPLLGTVDYVSILTALCIALGLANCALKNGQIAVEFLFDKLPSKLQGLAGTLINFTAMVFWGAAAWYTLDYGRSMAESGMVASTINVPLAPVVYIIALGFLALCLVLVIKTADSLRKVIE